MHTHPLGNLKPDDIVLDDLPDDVVASMQVRDRWMASLPYAEGGLEFMFADLQAWTPGQVVRVAFLGGTTELHKDIEQATRSIAEAGNVVLDFGLSNGAYRTWSPQDTSYTAEIRVSFDQGGYFSLVGTDSANANIGSPASAVGGNPNQRSLNLGGFQVNKPPTWAGTVRHEFLHALGFHHEHQNMRGPCESSFRWDDDHGYQPTKDSRGMYIEDSNGLRPGIYTYLAGYPNFWSKSKIDFNLRASKDDSGFVAGPFDRASVMLYRFPKLFYHVDPSPCAPSGDGQNLSDGDKRGLSLLYPKQASELSTIATRRENLLKTLEPEKGLEGTGKSPLMKSAAQRLRDSLTKLRP
jgi:hypothetical protein